MSELTALHGLPAAERRRIDWAILARREEEEGRGPRRPHVRVPAVLTIGDRSFPLGELPAWDELPDRLADRLIDQIAAELRGGIAGGAATITQYLDAYRILAVGQDGIQDIIRRTPEHVDVCGPIVGLLRRRSGMTLTALAAAMDRNRATVAAWEAGRPTKCHIGDVNHAAAAVGYSGAALVMVVDWLDKRPPVRILPGAEA